MPTLEGEVTPCPSGWISVRSALVTGSGTDISEGGDLLEVAVVCEGGEQLVASAVDL